MSDNFVIRSRSFCMNRYLSHLKRGGLWMSVCWCLVVTCWERAELLALVCDVWCGHFAIGILGQVWCLIAAIPDLCPFSYFVHFDAIWDLTYVYIWNYSILIHFYHIFFYQMIMMLKSGIGRNFFISKFTLTSKKAWNQHCLYKEGWLICSRIKELTFKIFPMILVTKLCP